MEQLEIRCEVNNKILRDLSYGVYVVGSLDDGRNVGCVINSAVQITSSPVTIAISINHDNYTNECIKKCNKFSVSVLNEDCDSSIIGTFGFSSSRDTDKYKDVKFETCEGLPIISEANGYIVCEVMSTLETETHTIFVGKVIAMDKTCDKVPMTYKYYHEVLKGKSPKNAPTYVDIEEEIKGNRWKCTMCGYIYEGDELPENFTCPICGQSREAFEKIN